MRTLVIGIPLPNASFDNYSFLSAPSISEYTRLIVEMSSVGRVVDEVITASAEHRTFAGQPLVNRPASGNEFSIAELLTMRRREAEAFFARGGTAVLIAHPETSVRPETRGSGIHPDPEARSGPSTGSLTHGDAVELWRSYDWLPAPPGFRYRQDLLPGFGNEAAEIAATGHPFQQFVQEFAPAFRYRVSAEDASIQATGGTVLARSAGGVAIAFDLPVGNGRVLVTPPLLDPSKDRQLVADALLAGFEGLSAPADVPEWMRKEIS